MSNNMHCLKYGTFVGRNITQDIKNGMRKYSHASPSVGFSRQEYWIGLPFPSPEYLPHPGIEPGSPAL